MGIHFHTLQMPDGTTEKIDAGSMSLSYGPLKGSVSGSNKAKRILVRSLSGVGMLDREQRSKHKIDIRRGVCAQTSIVLSG
jgi:hypothetical protein